jgi:Protein of unknown function (DUF2891)
MTALGRLDGPALDRLARSVIIAVQQEYPHKLNQELNSDSDVAPPRAINPSFFGSYDWHSAVHCHWTLVRGLAAGLPAATTRDAMEVLNEHLSPVRLAGELSFYSGAGGRVAERPYGWAWLVMLHAECARLASSVTDTVLRDALKNWAAALTPLADLLRGRLMEHFSSGLGFPIRSGTHANTAYALQLLHQAGGATRDTDLVGAVSTAARRWFLGDAPLPWAGPPSGDDFLDPPLVEAALMADVLGASEFAAWMRQVCPAAHVPDWSPATFVRDASEPASVHLEGLLISKAWCLDRLARTLEPGTPLARAARAGCDAHLAEVAKIDPGAGFSRSHWLPTYLVYLEGWLAGTL